MLKAVSAIISKTNFKFKFVDLGSSPPSNEYLSEQCFDKPEIYYPLQVYVCDKCWLVQTKDFSSGSDLFKEDYAYLSSTSSSWLEHCKKYVSQVVATLNLDESSFVVELASNDGYLLNYFKDYKVPCLGIEPTEGTAKIAQKNGIETLIEFFGYETAENVKKSLRKKDYNYSCNEQPINSFCNRELCRTRKHGIGLGNTALPEISNLTKINHKPQPQWFVNVDGERLELETEDLQIQARFKKACMEQLNTIIPRVADRQWDTLLRVLFSAIQIIEPPESLLIKNQLEDLIEDFAVRRAQGRQKSDILRGVPYTADGETMFRWKDLKKFLERQKWSFDIRKTGSMIEDIFSTTEKTLNIEGKRVRVWVMKAMEKQNTSFEKPKFKEEDAF